MNKLEKQVYKIIWKELYPNAEINYQDYNLENLSKKLVKKVKIEYVKELKEDIEDTWNRIFKMR